MCSGGAVEKKEGFEDESWHLEVPILVWMLSFSCLVKSGRPKYYRYASVWSLAFPWHSLNTITSSENNDKLTQTHNSKQKRFLQIFWPIVKLSNELKTKLFGQPVWLVMMSRRASCYLGLVAASGCMYWTRHQSDAFTSKELKITYIDIPWFVFTRVVFCAGRWCH